MRTEFEYNGKTYRTIAEFAQEYSIPASSISAGLKNGLTLEEIINKRKVSANRPKGGKACSYNGVEYNSLQEACIALGLGAPSYVYALMAKRGFDPNTALSYAIQHHRKETPVGNSREVTVAGMTFPSRQAALKHYGISDATVRNRINRNKVSFEDAVLYEAAERRHVEIETPILLDMSKLQKVVDESQLPINREFTTNKNKAEMEVIKAVLQALQALNYDIDWYKYTGEVETYIMHTTEEYGKRIDPCLEKTADCWILCGKTTEIIISDFLHCKCTRNELLKWINDMSRKYRNWDLWVDDEHSTQPRVMAEKVISWKRQMPPASMIVEGFLNLRAVCRRVEVDNACYEPQKIEEDHVDI